MLLDTYFLLKYIKLHLCVWCMSCSMWIERKTAQFWGMQERRFLYSVMKHLKAMWNDFPSSLAALQCTVVMSTTIIVLKLNVIVRVMEILIIRLILEYRKESCFAIIFDFLLLLLKILQKSRHCDLIAQSGLYISREKGIGEGKNSLVSCF